MAAQQACGVIHPRNFYDATNADRPQINILAFMSTVMFARAMTDDGDPLELNPTQVGESLKFSVYFGIANYLYDTLQCSSYLLIFFLAQHLSLCF